METSGEISRLISCVVATNTSGQLVVEHSTECLQRRTRYAPGRTSQSFFPLTVRSDNPWRLVSAPFMCQHVRERWFCVSPARVWMHICLNSEPFKSLDLVKSLWALKLRMRRATWLPSMEFVAHSCPQVPFKASTIMLSRWKKFPRITGFQCNTLALPSFLERNSNHNSD